MDRLNFLPTHFIIQTCYRGREGKEEEIRNKRPAENGIRRLSEESDLSPCTLSCSYTSAALSKARESLPQGKKKVLF